ncbi:MAG: ABC transporter ATP-binding protein [Cellvibrionaceae bacterium]|nr:ABC transporter ATP-binding protein [Cellvibrionaceae bacterium]
MEPALEIQCLQKTYNNAFEALKSIDLVVENGDFFALLGPNGAGKSTTIGIICSLITKTAGKVNIYGYDIDREFSKAKQLIGVVPQEFNFNVFEKVSDILVNQAGYYGMRRHSALQHADFYMKKLGLWDKRHEQARSLSGGMKRRLMIARALIHQPKLLILDEPTAGVDIELRRSMWSFLQEINQRGTTIILTTHYLEEAEHLCKNLAIIDRGEIVENTSVKALLQKLNKETFIFDLSTVLQHEMSVPGYKITPSNDASCEVEVEKGQPLNPVFDSLSKNQINVLSMRNKVNRLEELFVSLVTNNKVEREGQ